MKGFQLYESVVMYCQHLYSHIKKRKNTGHGLFPNEPNFVEKLINKT